MVMWKGGGMAGGRPRDVSVEARVLSATRDLLFERGYAGLRIDDVTARSGVAKTTIYRRWPSLAHVVVAAVAELVGDRDVEFTGDAERDLRTACRVGLDSLRRGGAGLAALALEVHRQDDPELRAAYRAALVDPIRGLIASCIRSGIEAGDFRNVDPYAAADALVGAAVYRFAILHESPGDRDLDAVLDVVVSGLRP